VFSFDPAGRQPMHPDSVTHRFSRLARRLGLRARLHDLRHYAATQLIPGGSTCSWRQPTDKQLRFLRPSLPTREAVRMDERSTKVAGLLHEAAETHHQVFRITDGADDDWASWYAEWLVTLSALPELLGGKVVRSELTYLLVRLDKAYTERWKDYYARELIRHFTPG
jgi:hypothetical protein